MELTPARPKKRRRKEKGTKKPDQEGWWLQFVLDCLEDGVVLCSGDAILHSNRIARKMLQLHDDIVYPVPLSALRWRTPADFEQFWDCIRDSCRTRSIQESVFYLQEGAVLHSTIYCCNDQEYSDKFCWIIKAKETVEKEAELKYYRLVDENPDIEWAVFEVDTDRRDHRVVAAGKRFREDCQFCGIPLETFQGEWISQLEWADETMAWWTEKFLEVANSPEGIGTFTNWMTLPNAAVYFQAVVKSHGKLANGHFIETISVTNLTKLKRLEYENRELKYTAEILSNFFEHAPIGMGTQLIDEENNNIFITSANPALRQMMRISQEELINGHDLRADGVPPENMEPFFEAYKESKQTGQAVCFEFSSFYLGYGLACLKAVSDKRTCILVQDISSMKNLQFELEKSKELLEETVIQRTKELQQALQVKSRFLANMSHELRTPLTGIMGTYSLLSQTELTDEQREYLQTGKVCGDQLLTIINDILDISKMEAGRMKLEERPLSIVNVIKESIAMVSFDADHKGLVLLSELDEQLPPTLIGDSTRLRQILLNLLNNAIKFSFKGTITIRANVLAISEESCRVLFSVEDQGIGIPEENQESLFQPFVQADTATTRKYGGTGLGLSISKKLTELMGGNMWLTSTPGVGSTFFFTVCMPLPPPNTELNPDNESPERSDVPSEKFHTDSPVLLVDDNELVQKVSMKLLQAVGFSNVDVAENGKVAVEAVKKKRYRIVLMDVMMPVMNGIEATRIIQREIPKEEQPVIVALTANAFHEDQQQYIEAGMSAVITKPIKKEELVKTLMHHLK